MTHLLYNLLLDSIIIPAEKRQVLLVLEQLVVVVAAIKSKSKYVKSATLQALCLSALTLPGLSIADNAAGTDASMHGKSNTNSASETPKQSLKQSDAFDEIDYQYTIYQEGKRDTYDTAPYTIDNNGIMTSTGPYKYQTNLQPITVDSEHASSRFRFGDRTRFGFNYVLRRRAIL